MSKELNRKSYLSKNVGNFPEKIEANNRKYIKLEDLRYGTNPHQPAAFYKPLDEKSPIGNMQILKTGKNGLSQTNLEDISYSMNIVKFFNEPACAVMKHVNPSGAAVKFKDDSLKDIYIKARDCDARAAFGSVATFNTKVDAETAEEIMQTFVECVVAPDYDEAALSTFSDNERFKFNRHIRIIKCGKLSDLPKYIDDNGDIANTAKILADGSMILAAPLLTSLKSVNDLKAAEGENKKMGKQKSETSPSEQQVKDILTAWYINISVRSNGVVIVKNGQTLAVGTGEQDRVGAVEQAVAKYNNKYKGENRISGASMASDGFFPFPDAIETAAEKGVKAIISPAGSLRDANVIKRANELNIALLHAPERIFSHH